MSGVTHPQDIDQVFGLGLVSEREAGRRILVALAGTGAGEVVPGTLFVDPERAQACVDGLGGIVADLHRSLAGLHQMAFTTPGRDQVSVNMAHNGGLMAQRAQAYVEVWTQQLDETRVALSRQLEAYRATEQANAGRRG